MHPYFLLLLANASLSSSRRIMGLYVSVVLVIGKFVRGFFSEISHSIMFEELPCVDRILKICIDIFLVRETGELELEEELYSKLIFLYRSPETMIKWTREKNQDWEGLVRLEALLLYISWMNRVWSRFSSVSKPWWMLSASLHSEVWWWRSGYASVCYSAWTVFSFVSKAWESALWLIQTLVNAGN